MQNPTPSPNPTRQAKEKGKGKMVSLSRNSQQTNSTATPIPHPPPQEPKKLSIKERTIILQCEPVSYNKASEIVLRNNINAALLAAESTARIAECKKAYQNTIHLIATANQSARDIPKAAVEAALTKAGIKNFTTRLDLTKKKFLVHGISPEYINGREHPEWQPTDWKTPLPYLHIKHDIESYNTGLSIIESPRWLLKIDKVHDKTVNNTRHIKSSMVITLEGNQTANALHTAAMKKNGSAKIILYGKALHVEPYVDCNAATHCANCQQFGHHAITCRSQSKCRFCGKNHYSSEHACEKDGCTAKAKGCAHRPTKCLNCNNTGHWAGDRECPNYRQAQEIVHQNRQSQLEKKIQRFNLPTPPKASNNLSQQPQGHIIAPPDVMNE